MRIRHRTGGTSRTPAFLFRLAVLLLLVSLWPRTAASAEKVFIFSSRGSRNIGEFRTYAEQAARLKAYGRVQVQISALADKSWYEIPEGGSPWHEYACSIPAPWKFYPHPRIAPHIPAGHVEQNCKLMAAKAAIIRELGLEAVFTAKNTHMLPESFFQEYPHLRGPRVDHPRRSRKEAFAWCVDLPETLEMIEWMMAEVKRHVPEIRTVISGTNDAGSGLCWAAAQYPGPNGPRLCRERNVGDRVRQLCETVHRGAVKGGGPVIFRWGNVNFWQNEMDVILPRLPENTYINSRDRSLMGLGTMINDNYPFLGIIDPLEVIGSMERYHRPGTDNVSINVSAMYCRFEDRPEATGKLLEVVEDCIAEPTSDLSGRLEKLRKLSARWGGEPNREKLFEAFYDMHQAFALKEAMAPRYSNFYCGVSMRHLTRPLVIKPELLIPAEEAYFLPHVFNVRENEARMDWIDLHGGRMYGTANWNDRGLRRALGMALGAARTLERLEGAPEEKWLRQVALSLKMWASEVRSIHNFYHAQLIRDRYAAILCGKPRVPEKAASWDGDPGNLEWNEIMRDEFDNTNELIALLENGGLELTAVATDPRHEDTFLLGPDLVGQLKQKASIIRAHWLDVQDYLAPPHK
ncbi:MAG: hypothetical protein JXQ83_01030 [Candidatus Glassbacteria bacterium]|nr:hypothetical protein [Candidatus Glassbacteria bacterium]